ncbi:hypothetical protein A45J_0110 [hot springs metagenome]|uniref:PDZ domain-containing protein n=1 Tax=hot springs metagenome TaxID=433727 RepID=A0A5J4KWQ0_9ZZZZ
MKKYFSVFVICALLLLSLSNALAQSHKPSIGIMVTNVKPDYARFIGLENDEGAYVQNMLKNSPAEKAGLKVGDVILEVNKIRIQTPQDFIRIIKEHKIEEPLELYIARGENQRFYVAVRLVEIAKLPQVEIAKPIKPITFNFGEDILDVDANSFNLEVLKSEKPVLVYFYAKWCPPCKKLVPLINEIAKENKEDFKVVALDVQKNEAIAKEYGIGGLIPSTILFSNGKEVEKIIVISDKKQIEALFSKYKEFASSEKAEVFASLGKEQGIRNIAFVKDSDNYIVSQNWGETINVWDYKNGRLINNYLSALSAISPDGKYIVLTNANRVSVRIIDVLTDRERIIQLSHFVESVAISSEGRFFASFGREKDGSYTLKIQNLQNNNANNLSFQNIQSFSIEKPIVIFSHDNKYLVLSEVNKTYIYDTEKMDLLGTLNHPYESFRTLRFTPDSRYIFAVGGKSHLFDLKTLTDSPVEPSIIGFFSDSLIIPKRGNIFELIDAQTKEKIREFKGHIGPVTIATISKDGKLILSGSSDGTVRLWDEKTGKEIAQFIAFTDGEWIILTPEGYYSSSLNGHKHVNVRLTQSAYTIEQFYDVFYRPDIVSSKLKGEDISGLVTLTIDEAIKNPPPIVEITSLPAGTDKPEVRVCYQVKSTGGGIGEVRIFHNGKLIHSDGFYREVSKISSSKNLASLSGKEIYEQIRGIKITEKERRSPIKSSPKGDIFEECRLIDAVAGENEISIAAFNSQNTVQSLIKTKSFKANIISEEPHLYILCIGINKYKDKKINLKFAAKDALDMVKKLKTQSATIYNPAHIHAEALVDEKATKTNIISKINEIAQKIKPVDSFIFFVAGHGVLLENQYYMLTHGFNGDFNERDLINSNEIIEMSKQIKSLSQFFIFDTCHAGGVDYIVGGLYDARMSVLAKKMGLHIYASASSFEQALDGYKDNGLFTYTLLDGLNNKREADINKDKKISIKELGGYSKKKTIEISQKLGHTQTPFIINFGMDRWVYNLEW